MNLDRCRPLGVDAVVGSVTEATRYAALTTPTIGGIEFLLQARAALPG